MMHKLTKNGSYKRLTTVGVDMVGLQEADLEVVQHCRLVQVAEGREVILSHQDVRVSKEGQWIVFRTDWICQCLWKQHKQCLEGES